MKQERENEVNLRKKAHSAKIIEVQKQREQKDQLTNELYTLFKETNFQKRGKSLESVLNKYFKVFDLLLRDDFKRVGDDMDGVVEQIDGIIEIDNQIFLVEMKWRKDSIGVDDIYAHLGRIYHRAGAHGVFISASPYSPAALNAAKEALINNAILVLCDLEEFVRLIDSDLDLRRFLRDKIQAAIIEKNPFKKFGLT